MPHPSLPPRDPPEFNPYPPYPSPFAGAPPSIRLTGVVTLILCLLSGAVVVAVLFKALSYALGSN